jgi:ribosome-associated heat shock protein Hsp15
MQKVRIDKWLWAARFYKTRSIARQAIDGGKVQVDGQRVKPSREMEVGMLVHLRQGWDQKDVEVVALSEQRRGAVEAALLYRETEESIKKRELEAQQRLALRGTQIQTEGKPNSRQRRHIHRFKRDSLDDS